MAAIIVVALVAAWLFIGNYIPKLIRYIISGILDVVAIVLFIVTPMNLIIRIIIIVLLAFMAIIWLAKFNRFNGNKKIDWGQSRVDGIMFTAGVIIITLIIDLF
ncbi:MAG: hypothetical protein ACLS6S_05785 [Lachnospira eligens]|jgi:hypothetical protein